MLDNVSGSEQEDALAQKTENHQQQQTEIKDVIEAVHRHHNEGAGKFQVGVSCQRENGAGVISLRRRNSRNLRRRQSWTENEVENHRKKGKSTLESQTVGLTAGLEQQLDQSTCESQHSISCVQPVFESRSGQRVSSEFNDRGGKRERQ